MATQLKVKPLVLTIASLLASNQMAYAAENEENQNQEVEVSGVKTSEVQTTNKKNDDIEVIEVSGFRGV
ncbi:hypothetical protein [Catenovulum sediminis]|uniref:hypothetical protein n=1 Tax=Catenovulum sediminis TaxID=1740262 RepID=UPI00117F8FD8|nr:hypothetical protein [Catenovulum sediminis]